MSLLAGPDKHLPLAAALRPVWPAARTTLIFGFFINLLLFVSPLYMLQIYDRAIPSRNGATLAGLTLLALYLTAVYAALDMLRGRILAQAAKAFDDAVAEQVFTALHRAQLQRPGGDRGQPLRDVATLRDLFAGPGLIALSDVPWMPLFVGACFLLHPWFGVLAIFAGLLFVSLSLINELVTRASLKGRLAASSRANAYAEQVMRNGEVLQAMAMLAPVRQNWLAHHGEALAQSIRASHQTGRIGALTKFVRLALQTAILGLGAWLAIQKDISPGVIIAASIIIGRAMSPLEAVIAHWSSFVAARAAYDRLTQLLRDEAAQPDRLALPAPAGHLMLDELSVAPPGGRHLVLSKVSFRLDAGEMLAVIGPSGAGKSCLARALCGIWQPLGGSIRLDGADLRHWDGEALGQHLGYLPQDVELFAGTVAQNIARFREAAPEDIVAIATLAGCHDMIQQLPDGYNTEIGEGGMTLSGGQRQRIGLARAFFGMPPLVVLDEPNASLDSDGEAVLVEALRRFRQAGRTIVLITHRPSILACADKVLVLMEGQTRLFGPREDVLARIAPAVAA